MAQSGARQQPNELTIGEWIAFWAQLVVLAFLAIVGAFFASADAQPGDYACGLILTIAALLLATLRVKGRFDGQPAEWSTLLFVDNRANLLPAIVVFTLLGGAGIIVAANVGQGGLYVGGVALFVICVIAVLLNIKHAFDELHPNH